MVLVLEEKVGPVRCGVSVTGARSGHAVFDVPRKPEALTFRADRDAIAAALGIAPRRGRLREPPAERLHRRRPFAFVPVRDLDAIGRAHVRPAAWDAAFPPAASAAYLYCRETRGPAHQFHARMFAPGVGIVEDPATGSAAAAFSAVIARFDQPPAGSHRYLIEQGYEMGRPSLIDLEVDMDSGEVAAARIGGDAVLLAEGTLDL
ncbi:MAG: PhzF family phenazine biosynthesis isomerase [Bauldia sp.]